GFLVAGASAPRLEGGQSIQQGGGNGRYIQIIHRYITPALGAGQVRQGVFDGEFGTAVHFFPANRSVLIKWGNYKLCHWYPPLLFRTIVLIIAQKKPLVYTRKKLWVFRISWGLA